MNEILEQLWCVNARAGQRSRECQHWSWFRTGVMGAGVKAETWDILWLWKPAVLWVQRRRSQFKEEVRNPDPLATKPKVWLTFRWLMDQVTVPHVQRYQGHEHRQRREQEHSNPSPGVLDACDSQKDSCCIQVRRPGGPGHTERERQENSQWLFYISLELWVFYVIYGVRTGARYPIQTTQQHFVVVS